MPWAASLVLTIGGLLILGGLIAFIAGLRHDWKSKQRALRKPDLSVGRDVYREMLK
jgi:hypothetical protein